MEDIKIVGICLVKNEDLFIKRVIKNVLDFCDELIILDNHSEDGTFEILSNLAEKNPKISLRKIKNPSQSHSFLEKYANTKTWVFKVDGDEIYDPEGLKKLRQILLEGKYTEYWRVDGNSLNCTEIDAKKKKAHGYLAPPSKAVAIIYNFNAILSWQEPNNERLHGKNMSFKAGFHKGLYKILYKELSWEDSYFRCLHLSFIKRSSLENKTLYARLNPQESMSKMRLLLTFCRNMASGKISFKSKYKNDRYKKAPLTKKDVSTFFPETK